MPKIRIDDDVAAELRRRRLPGEDYYVPAIRRALREKHLEDKLERFGLTSFEMGELVDLRSVRGPS
jgi:Arc/MetJ family transcription regulator